MKAQLTVLFFSLTMFSSYAQLTYVPDDAFEAYLESFPYLSNGVPGDNYISSNYLSSCTSIFLNGSTYPVVDFTGIEAFTNLSSIFLTSFFTATIDISMVNAPNPEVKLLSNPGIETIYLPSKMRWLQVEICSLLNNVIFLPNSQIVSPSVVGSSGIYFKYNNSLELLDLSGLSLLNSTVLGIDSNPLLTCVNIQNGDNFVFSAALITDNNQLSCVQVDNPTYSSNASTWVWQDQAGSMDQYYSISCSNCTLGLEETTQAFTLSPNPVNDLLNITVPSSFVGEIFHLLNAQGENIQHGVLSSEQHAISVEQLPAGVYVLTIDGLEPKRVVKL
jgi:hypothetical protein